MEGRFQAQKGVGARAPVNAAREWPPPMWTREIKMLYDTPYLSSHGSEMLQPTLLTLPCVDWLLPLLTLL